jgi:hypothetical protein
MSKQDHFPEPSYHCQTYSTKVRHARVESAVSIENMFNQTKTTSKFRQKPLMYLLLFFHPNILVKDLQMWKLPNVLHAFDDSYFSYVEGDFT